MVWVHIVFPCTDKNTVHKKWTIILAGGFYHLTLTLKNTYTHLYYCKTKSSIQASLVFMVELLFMCIKNLTKRIVVQKGRFPEHYFNLTSNKSVFIM